VHEARSDGELVHLATVLSEAPLPPRGSGRCALAHATAQLAKAKVHCGDRTYICLRKLVYVAYD
jgi:hypothetical protein